MIFIASSTRSFLKAFAPLPLLLDGAAVIWFSSILPVYSAARLLDVAAKLSVTVSYEKLLKHHERVFTSELDSTYLIDSRRDLVGYSTARAKPKDAISIPAHDDTAIRASSLRLSKSSMWTKPVPAILFTWENAKFKLPLRIEPDQHAAGEKKPPTDAVLRFLFLFKLTRLHSVFSGKLAKLRLRVSVAHGGSMSQALFGLIPQIY
jgi:hypothetical protein